MTLSRRHPAARDRPAADRACDCALRSRRARRFPLRSRDTAPPAAARAARCGSRRRPRSRGSDASPGSRRGFRGRQRELKARAAARAFAGTECRRHARARWRGRSRAPDPRRRSSLRHGRAGTCRRPVRAPPPAGPALRRRQSRARTRRRSRAEMCTACPAACTSPRCRTGSRASARSGPHRRAPPADPAGDRHSTG